MFLKWVTGQRKGLALASMRGRHKCGKYAGCGREHWVRTKVPAGAALNKLLQFKKVDFFPSPWPGALVAPSSQRCWLVTHAHVELELLFLAGRYIDSLSYFLSESFGKWCRDIWLSFACVWPHWKKEQSSLFTPCSKSVAGSWFLYYNRRKAFHYH